MFGVATSVGLGEVSKITPPMAGVSGACVIEGVESCGCGLFDTGLGFGDVVVVIVSEEIGVGEISGLAINDGKIGELGSRLGLPEADGDSDGEVVAEANGVGDIVGEGVVLGVGENVGDSDVVSVGLGSKLGSGITDFVGSNWA
jgi:hypothetical protein